MNKAIKAQSAVNYQLGNIDVRISNATFLRDEYIGDVQHVTLNVTGIRIAEVDWCAVEEILQSAGISEEDSMNYVHHFALKVHRMELAKAIAERMERVG